ncbi:hypothetical protein NIES4071_69020 [Calothrix sp. NIES-4071]|nr:hypothetical protein NIES4071_69020 [Calothrix sp. NIES-4071]BAZ61179.1 hypothetical protein NIES4105_68970 [Calothrix sp. NIES-4105]
MSQELPKTGQSKTYKPTPEQLARWKRLDENDGAIAGRLPPEEQQARIVKEFLNTDFVADQLEKVRIHKEKLLKKLKSAEEYEQLLVEKQQKQS